MTSAGNYINPSLKDVPPPSKSIIYYTIQRTTDNPNHIIQQLTRLSSVGSDEEVENIDHDSLYDFILTAIQDKSKSEIVNFCIQLSEIDEKSKGRKIIDYYLSTTDLPLRLTSYLQDDIDNEVETGRNCAAIAGLCGEDGPIQKSFYKSGTICTVLTDALSKYSESTAILVDICEAIRKIARNSDCQEAFSHTTCPKTVISCFQRHFSDPYIIKHLCRVIINTGFSDKTRDIYYTLESYRFMTNALKKYQNIPDIISEICWAISNIATLNEFKVSFGENGCCSLLIELGDEHWEHLDCLKEILSAICNLAVNDKNEEEFGNLGLCRRLCKWTKQYLERYRKQTNQVTQGAQGHNGFIDGEKKSLKEIEELFRKLADALNNLSFLSQNKDKLVEANAVELLTKLFRETKHDYELIGSIASVIGSLAVDNQVQDHFFNERIVEDLVLVLASIRKSYDEKQKHQHQKTIETLRGASSTTSTTAFVTTTDELNNTVESTDTACLKNHSNVQRYSTQLLEQRSLEQEKNMQYCLLMICSALKNLVALDANAEQLVSSNGTIELIWIIHTFLNNQELMKEALWTIANLSFNEESRRAFLENDYIGSISFQIARIAATNVVQRSLLLASDRIEGSQAREEDDHAAAAGNVHSRPRRMTNIDFFFSTILKLGHAYLSDQSMIKEISVMIYNYLMNSLPPFFEVILVTKFTGTSSAHCFHRYLLEEHSIHTFYLLILQQNTNDLIAITASCWVLRNLISDDLKIEFFQQQYSGDAFVTVLERVLWYHQDEVDHETIQLLNSIKIVFQRNTIEVSAPFALD